MLIAVTCDEKSLEAPVARRFGKARYVFVADPDSRVVRIIDNSGHAELHLGAGARTAEMLARLGVSWVATGKIGEESFHILEDSGVKVASHATGSCREILDRLAAGGLQPTPQPDPSAGCEADD
jgi:predicted Fe-Mo cluster-binding NifX family protein